MAQTEDPFRPSLRARMPRSRPSMTPSQLRAYLLARETLRRLSRMASISTEPSAARKS